MRAGFVRDGDDFTSPLGRVRGTLYVGRTSAGGRGDRIDLDADGAPDVVFSESCDFVLQLADGRVTALEADRAVTATANGRTYSLPPYAPSSISEIAGARARPVFFKSRLR